MVPINLVLTAVVTAFVSSFTSAHVDTENEKGSRSLAPLEETVSIGTLIQIDHPDAVAHYWSPTNADGSLERAECKLGKGVIQVLSAPNNEGRVGIKYTGDAEYGHCRSGMKFLSSEDVLKLKRSYEDKLDRESILLNNESPKQQSGSLRVGDYIPLSSEEGVETLNVFKINKNDQGFGFTSVRPKPFLYESTVKVGPGMHGKVIGFDRLGVRAWVQIWTASGPAFKGYPVLKGRIIYDAKSSNSAIRSLK